MLYNNLKRLPEESTVAIYKPFDEDTQSYLENDVVEFMCALESDDTDSAIKILDGSIYSNVTGPMTMLTSSVIEFKVADHVVFYGVEKEITAVAIIYSNKAVKENLLYQRNNMQFYKQLLY